MFERSMNFSFSHDWGKWQEWMTVASIPNQKFNWCNFTFVESCFPLWEGGRVCEFLAARGDEWYLASCFLGWGRAEQAKPPINTLGCGHFIDTHMFHRPLMRSFFFSFKPSFYITLMMGCGMSVFSVAPHLHDEEQSILDWGTKRSCVDGLPARHQHWAVDGYSSSQSSPCYTDGHLLPLAPLISGGLLCHISFIRDSKTHYMLCWNYRVTIRRWSTALTMSCFT